MREIFPREAADNPEPFTGERLTASVHGQIELEHYHRYLFSRGFCRDRDVLDVASGEGYGAAHLAQVARQVVGVEYAGPTVHNAARNFPRANLCFVQADARSLPVGNASIDVVTSFETIEHFDRQEDFVAEVRRVLRPDGCFIVSTPDRDVYTPPGAALNPFHVHEFDRAEFLDLMHRYFRYVSLIRQRPMLASALMPEEAASVAPLIFERVEDQAFASDTALPGAPYLIAIASEVVPKLAPVSLLIERSEADNVRAADQEAELVRLRISEAKAREEAETERQAAEAERETARAAVEAAQKSVEQAEADAKAAAVTLTHTRAALVEANTELERLSHSLWHFLCQYLLRIWRRFVH
jgi:ubiquinone/menaquinone biosynthesis C-methylase UbiE